MELPSEFRLYAECSTGEMGDFARIAVIEHDRADRAEKELADIKKTLLESVPALARYMINLETQRRKLERQLALARELNSALTNRWGESYSEIEKLTRENELLQNKIAQASKALTE